LRPILDVDPGLSNGLGSVLRFFKMLEGAPDRNHRGLPMRGSDRPRYQVGHGTSIPVYDGRLRNIADSRKASLLRAMKTEELLTKASSLYSSHDHLPLLHSGRQPHQDEKVNDGCVHVARTTRATKLWNTSNNILALKTPSHCFQASMHKCLA